MVVQALSSWNGFHVFETSSGAHGALFWPKTVEGHPEVAHAERFTKGFCFVGRGSRHILI